MGLHLMECSGNGRLTRYGLIGVAHWEGVLLSEILARVKRKPGSARVVVSGFDTYIHPSKTSEQGASWSFEPNELNTARAFLATRMNGQPLTRDHGAPIRLIVPGWYGCACIKWVNSIMLVDAMSDATSQMREFASRTLQNGIPKLAKEYEAATIDHAAMPIRVEKWNITGKVGYRVVGILWGGAQHVRTLGIRFNPDQSFAPVNWLQKNGDKPWRMWASMWFPLNPGTYTIRLGIVDPRVRTRKLIAGHYDRSVLIGHT